MGRLLSGLSACRRSWISVPTPCAAFPRVCARGQCLWSRQGGALLVSRQSIPSTAVSGSLDQSVVAGGIPGVDGQCCRLQIVAVSLVCWKSGPTPVTTVTLCRLVGLRAVHALAKRSGTDRDVYGPASCTTWARDSICLFSEQPHTTDISSRTAVP